MSQPELARKLCHSLKNRLDGYVYVLLKAVSRQASYHGHIERIRREHLIQISHHARAISRQVYAPGVVKVVHPAHEHFNISGSYAQRPQHN